MTPAEVVLDAWCRGGYRLVAVVARCTERTARKLVKKHLKAEGHQPRTSADYERIKHERRERLRRTEELT